MKQQQIKTRPHCPFCGDEVAQPQDQDQRKLGEFKVGHCQCGAVYACDATGHNIGSAMIEALVYACNDDWELAWELLPDQDYLTGRVESYDEITHQILEQRHLDGRYVRGVLYFVRLQKEITEIAQQRAEQKRDYLPPVEPERDPARPRQRADKKEVQRLALAGDIDGLVALTFDDVRTLRFLQRLLYTPDDDQRWWLAHVIGQVCARVATRQPGVVSDLLHRLFDASSDSAAANWGLVETMGSIIAARPDIYGAFARHLLRYINHVSTRPLVLWALGTVAARRPDLVRANQFYQLFNLLNDSDPLVRALTIRLLGRAGAREVGERLQALSREQTPVTIYEEGRPQTITVGDLAAEALKMTEKVEQA
ncbi:DVU0298 family protein [Desulfurivibrio alkaliphilus]|uniref:Heat repeat-containing PBS lyase n=1 Tax=Desulfurivibrio alkaliphilus (strain DSM 19089 / UNIQEM U267 / AHT2) TaxID=589865 RepID=D6Z491_DESAT|nr:DVU0298 family protein [Desulfurivibrio alkaliphilus]ADH86366.1 heat repeat-containing PBS lyase [Desulfurivibrio alkaliphilus AHT 2]